MDFKVPEEVSDLLVSVRRFREEFLMPLEHEFLLSGGLPPEARRNLQMAAKERGLWALGVPEEHGGQGLSLLGQCMVHEELYKHPAAFECGGEVEPALYHGTPNHQERYLKKIVSGEKTSCIGFTEPDAGSDFARIKTTAIKDGDHWVINGTKTFITGGDVADFVILFATRDPALGSRGIVIICVDKGTPGYSVGKQIPTMGDDWEPVELIFDNCRVPDANRIGNDENGWEVATDQLNHGRERIAAGCLGIASRCLEIASDWSKQRVTWGKPIAHRQSIQFMIANSAVELDAARLLTYRAAWMHDEGLHPKTETYMAKYYATEMAQNVADRSLEIMGGLGYTLEVPIQSFYRQARLWRLGHGTSEIMQWLIARNLLGLSSRDA